ncbi:heavy metal translocating P-type ATPase [Anaerolineae bacterium CFX9]|jgi:Zn2+/Cd2+-exporting ATPase|nr:heavy metal translocating P-type ATPase [Geitlerinema splendidum]MDL1902529.1 heavy metal translocating P-type ATPase [Anaerolineae bacterium CFX9]
MTRKVQFNLDLLLPGIQTADECVTLLNARLAKQKGIDQAHIVEEDGQAKLCLHFDPNLVSLATVQRLASEASGEITSRYRHERIAFSRLNTADAGLSLERVLRDLNGMIHANVNYAAGLIFVGYDTSVLQRSTIDAEIQGLGAKIVTSPQSQIVLQHDAEAGHDDDHDHGSAPAFLPHWMQERWTLILVGLAAVFFLAGWLGERFLGFSESAATVFYILAYIAGGYDVATHAIPALFKGKLDTDILMLAAAGGAALLGEFGEGAFLLLLFAIGHAGEHYALDRARNAISALGALMPKTAQLRRGDQIVETPVEQVQIDDVVVTRPGDRIPVDGVIAAGSSAIDQSPITGESVPVTKTTGDEVFAGTVNKDNALDIRVTRVAADNTLSRVMRLVADAQSQQSPTQQFADRFTSRFVPLVFLATALIIVVPALLNLLTLEQSFYRGMLLLVAASPCALAIGTPAAVLAGIAQAARNGVLIKGGVHLENLGALRAIAFDKTGTITSGVFSVTDVIPLNGVTADELLSAAGAVEQQSNHPLAQAVVRTANERRLMLPQAGGLENVAGKGVISSIGGESVRIGSLKLFADVEGLKPDEALTRQVDDLEKAGRSTMVVSKGLRFMGILGLADTPRPNVPQIMSSLRGLGVEHLVMLTGDNDDVARNIAGQVGLTEVQAELLPEDKLRIVKTLEGKYSAIAMIGDGVNDAPALATATVGIAMGGAGTAVALETADVALMGDDLSKLPFAVGLSRASRRIIVQNLMISFGVIALLIVTSVLGLVQLGFAVLLHEGSTLIVVGNALRLLGFKDQKA